ncbi:MAG: hypothetical protein RMJ98_23225 [Myxococcales bacterium]|nr:hypothetical protein [Myxococcales bacterium]
MHSRSVLGHLLRATPGSLEEVAPPAILALLRVVGERGLELRRALARLASSGGILPADALRAMYVAIALGLCEVV